MPKANVRLVSGPRFEEAVPTIWVQVGQDKHLRAITLGESEVLRLLECTTQCLRDMYVRRFRTDR
jgi:hypothetical protein